MALTFGTIFVQAFLENGLLGARTASRDDLTKLFACQLAAYLLGTFLILRVHAPQAKIREFLALRGTHLAFYPLALALSSRLTGAPLSRAALGLNAAALLGGKQGSDAEQAAPLVATEPPAVPLRLAALRCLAAAAAAG